MANLPNDQPEVHKRPQISDRKGRELFEATCNRVIDKEIALDVLGECDENRLGDTLNQHISAYVYLGLAFRLLELENTDVIYEGRTFCAAEVFHFAGHAFRGIGQLNRAADAYWRSGVIGSNDKKIVSLAIRSFARAKTCYSEIGETEKSDQMHYLEWELRKTVAGNIRKAMLNLWKITSGYGTSTYRWVVSLLLLVAFFSTSYEVLHCFEKLKIGDGQSWTPIVSPIYFCIVTTTTVGYGDIFPNSWTSQSVVVLNILSGYALLLIGATILGRKILGR